MVQPAGAKESFHAGAEVVSIVQDQTPAVVRVRLIIVSEIAEFTVPSNVYSSVPAPPLPVSKSSANVPND